MRVLDVDTRKGDSCPIGLPINWVASLLLSPRLALALLSLATLTFTCNAFPSWTFTVDSDADPTAPSDHIFIAGIRKLSFRSPLVCKPFAADAFEESRIVVSRNISHCFR